MRAWLVIPIGGALAAATGLAAPSPTPGLALALGLAGAATAAATRRLAGDAPAALAAALATALLCAALLVDAHAATIRHALAVAGCAWTLAELAAPYQPDSTPLVAMLPAIVAGVLDLAFVPLIPIAGARLVTAPWRRPRAIVVVPIAGALATLVGALALARTTGSLGELGDAWLARGAHPVAPATLATHLADTLGPFVIVAAVAGLAAFVHRDRYTQLALVATLAAALVADRRAGSIGAPTVALAALLAGQAIGRLAGTIRLATGQAIVATTLGLLVIAPAALAIALPRLY